MLFRNWGGLALREARSGLASRLKETDIAAPLRFRLASKGTFQSNTKRVKVGVSATRMSSLTRVPPTWRSISASRACFCASSARRASSATTSSGRRGGGPFHPCGRKSTKSFGPASMVFTVTPRARAKRAPRLAGSPRAMVTYLERVMGTRETSTFTSVANSSTRTPLLERMVCSGMT